MTEIAIRTVSAAEAAKPTEFTEAEHMMLDAMNVPTNRFGRALLFREMHRTGLDPFAKHLYLREDWNKKANRNVYSVASTIAGFEIVAKRQPTYEGQTAPQWCDKSGKWFEVWVADAPPVAARIGVYVRGYREPMWGIARFNEYKPEGSGGFMWTRMASHMIAKVAEALAIRKAYPDQLSGVYTDDEMQQADARKDETGDSKEPVHSSTRRQGPVDDEWNTATGQQLPPPAPGVPNADDAQIGEIVRLLGVKRGVFNGKCARVVSELVRRRVDNPRTLSQSEARSIIETLTAEPDNTQATEEQPPGPVITKPQQRMMQAMFKTAGITDRDGQHAFITRVLGAPVTSRNALTPQQFDAVVNALGTGEVPPAPDGPAPSDEGISEFDALDQMILDVAGPEAAAEVETAIRAELERKGITRPDAELLLERLREHVRQAKAGAPS